MPHINYKETMSTSTKVSKFKSVQYQNVLFKQNIKKVLILYIYISDIQTFILQTQFSYHTDFHSTHP